MSNETDLKKKNGLYLNKTLKLLNPIYSCYGFYFYLCGEL